MNRITRRTIAWIGCLIGLMLPQAAAAGEPVGLWRQLMVGMEHREVYSTSGDPYSSFHLHVYRIDLTHWRVIGIDSRQVLGQPRGSVEALAKKAQAVLAVNGTYFDEKERPLGLLINKGKVLNPLRQADWGVLAVHGDKATLVHTRDWKKNPRTGVDFAIQVGPRLVVDGRPLKLKRQVARRAAIGIMPDGRLVVVVSVGAPVESGELARVMSSSAQSGLGCLQAVMMDGGGSAQLFAAAGGEMRAIVGAWPVPNAVGFVPRSQ